MHTSAVQPSEPINPPSAPPSCSNQARAHRETRNTLELSASSKVSSLLLQPTSQLGSSEDVQRSDGAGDVLLGSRAEAPRGEGLHLRMHIHGAVLLLLLRDLRVLPRLPLLLLRLAN